MICGDIMSQKDAQWLRCGTVLKVFLAFRLEVKALGNPKGKSRAGILERNVVFGFGISTCYRPLLK
jgi:hypothetical protein